MTISGRGHTALRLIPKGGSTIYGGGGAIISQSANFESTLWRGYEEAYGSGNKLGLGVGLGVGVPLVTLIDESDTPACLLNLLSVI